MGSKTVKKLGVAVARKKILVVGCSHGEFLNNQVAEELFKFKADFKPDITVHLGDFLDTTAWRSGARGTADETKSPADDFKAAQRFLGRLEPDLVFIGNHDHRPYTYLDHPNALISDIAAHCVCDIRHLVREQLKAELVEGYDYNRSWRRIGEVLYGHGWRFNVNAVRSHAQDMGTSTCIAHIHYGSIERPVLFGAPVGHSTGLLADIDELTYAHRRAATLRWSWDVLAGEFNDKETHFYIKTLMRRKQLGEAIPAAECSQ